MEIVDTVPYFLKNYKPSVDFLKTYYAEYPEVFEEYFPRHCQNTDARHERSIDRYDAHFQAIEQVHQQMPLIVQETANTYREMYGLNFPVQVNLLVGGFGSNAYTHRMFIPDISFAMEKLSPNPEHLKVIVAHEFGHAAQNILSNQAGIDWEVVEWTNPFIWLNQEGAATHFSRKIVKGVNPSVYFSYEDGGENWLNFAKANEREIIKAFAKDVEELSPQALFKEWFSINGGATFGHSRLAYFIGDRFVQEQIERLGEIEAIVAWKDANYKEEVAAWVNVYK
ncbi:DUF5700 domain-containing putative Zn-dependent protease [Planococcus shixiaomingii]|uniref:DUF5700 domain-containing putative Zn-dependent protease n=1 Tax=Planococcus shixiaomingii TaxID=3058393 RepID=UPI002634A8F5|nr:DUF5700 domain-containing putative Zn-dependent protease [Planococcus sp. N022]WKA55591.1 hypothetical protein QWY21_04170 [Planococcus sp. N022]